MTKTKTLSSLSFNKLIAAILKEALWEHTVNEPARAFCDMMVMSSDSVLEFSFSAKK